MPKLVHQMECFLNQFGFVSCNTMSKISDLESDLNSCCAILIDVHNHKRKSWGGKCKTTRSTSRGQAFDLLSSSSIIRLNPNQNRFVTQPFVLAEFWTRVKLMLKPPPISCIIFSPTFAGSGTSSTTPSCETKWWHWCCQVGRHFLCLLFRKMSSRYDDWEMN